MKGRTRLERGFAFGLIVSRLDCGRVERANDHLQSKVVKCRHRRIYQRILNLVVHSTFVWTTFRRSQMTPGGLHIHLKGRGHFRTQYSWTRRSSCEFGNVTQIRPLLTTARYRISDCFELTVIKIIVRSRYKHNIWWTWLPIEDILSKLESMSICLSSSDD